MDDKEFFQEATKKICGSLEIENGLWECLLYLKNFMPAEEIGLNIYDPGIGMIETIARANYKGGQITSIKTVVPQKVFSESLFREEPLSLRTIDRFADNPIAEPFSRSLGISPEAAGIIMRPRLKGSLLGGVAVINNSGKKFSQEHARLLDLLNDPFGMALSNYLRYREVARLKDLLSDNNQFLQKELRNQIGEEIVGANFGLKGVMELVRSVAPLSSPVLLLGETGVGKEVIASAVHNWSSRRDGPFIKVNCGAIPETLIDSELFGYEKGAFTGAIERKPGRFERAHGGTIFLDEIGDLPGEAQSRLLRVLQEKEIERVGGTESIKVDIRVIAATHRNLEDMLARRQFRKDLYFRLRVFPIVIPPLRNRLADIPALVQHFMGKKAREMGLVHIPTVAPAAIERLMHYHWPGNVRELQNAVERELILSQGQPLTFEYFKDTAGRDIQKTDTHDRMDNDSLGLDLVISRHITKVLGMSGGKVGGKNGAASLLKINSSTLRRKMEKLGIPFGRKAPKR